MNFKRYFEKIKNKDKEPKRESKIVKEIEQNVVKKVNVSIKKTLNFVDPKKDPHEYLKRYLNESKYKDWFNRNYPNHTIYDAVGLSVSDYLTMKRKLFPESETNIEEKLNKERKIANTNTNLKSTTTLGNSVGTIHFQSKNSGFFVLILIFLPKKCIDSTTTFSFNELLIIFKDLKYFGIIL